MASPTGIRPSAASTRPKASWVEACSGYVSSSASGRPEAGDGDGGVNSGGSALTCRASGDSGAKPAHSSPGDKRAVRSSSIWAALVTIVWLSGSPANGRPQPLIVWARITEGRARSPAAAA